MNKALVIAAITILVLGLGSVGYYFLAVDDATLARRAMQGHGAVTCTFVDPDTTQEAALYVRDGDMRITTTGTGFTLENTINTDEDAVTNMLILGDTGYMWVEGEAEGLEFSTEATSEDMVETEDTLPLRNIDDEEQFEREYDEHQFDCTRGVDASMFELPQDIEFVDFDTLFRDTFMEMEGDMSNLEEEFEDLLRQLEEEDF